VAGRVTAIRKHGKAAFLDLRDAWAKIQVYIKKNQVSERDFELYQLLDVGDILGVKGALFRTRTGELTVQARELAFLGKALRPLPEKFHGLRDTELRYRQRYLDLIANPEVAHTFRLRSQIISLLRKFLNAEGFLEVETPMMHPIPGGATARPFITHHNTLQMDLYLRIAPELYLKRLLVGGFSKVFEINRNFRNEGISTRHNPEFTMLEVYQAYADYNDMMKLVENTISFVIRELGLPARLPFGELKIDYTPPWPRLKYMELYREQVGFSWGDGERALARARELEIPVEGRSLAAIENDLFEKLVEPNLSGPVFVTDYPVAICPLTKRKPGEPEVCERFELFIAGMEIANAFTELNDPVDQRDRFEQQLKQREEGAEVLDEDFILALEHGMPPAGGVGLGIDRLVMLLTNKQSIREVILFPLLRRRED
jgi:lysyl-tRNA synthetase class 2